MHTSDGDSRAHGRVKQLFLAVVDLPDAAAQRAALRERGADDATLAEVMRLLAHGELPTQFSSPVAAAAVDWLDHEIHPGDRLGAWTLDSVIGHGGMGRVYLVSRSDGHYQQRAAVKLLRGWSGPEALTRLSRERQILAHLHHPNIARLLDGGATPAGQPYLVMEYVDGLAIDQHCTQHRLGLEARLALFQMVCDAVAQAHKQLVIHCDIKPSNVVVGDGGRAMLLDFGIAQLQGQLSDKGVEAMTPGYASPEQEAGLTPGIPSDIYSLGRLLQVLVQPLAAQHRRGDELAAIVAHACEQDPGQRYGSVGELQADLRRLLAHEPLSALPSRLSYRARKWLRRRWPWALAGSSALAVGLFLTVQLVQERDRAVQESERARLQAETTRESSRFLMSLFTGADPKLTGIPDIPKAILLDKGRERLGQEMSQNPAMRARLLVVLGDVYERTGHRPDAITAFAEAARLFSLPEVAQPLAEADALRRQALVLNNNGQTEAAEAPARRTLALRQHHDPKNLQDIADAENRLGIVLMNLRRYDEAATRIEHAYTLREQGLGANDPNTSSTLHNLARLNQLRGEPAMADRQLVRVMASKRRTLGPFDDRLLGSLELHGSVLSDLQRHDAAERALREALAGWIKVFGADNGNVAIARHRLGRALVEAGRLEAAGDELQEAWRVETLPGRKPSVRGASIRLDLALWNEVQGRLPQALADGEAALALLRSVPDVPPLTLAQALHGLARTLWRAGRADEATALLAQAQALREPRLPPGNDELLQGRLLEGELAIARHDGARAAALIDEITRWLPPTQLGQHLDLLALRGHAAAEAGQPAEAARWLSRAWQGQIAWRHLAHPAQLPLGLELLAALQASKQASPPGELRLALEASARGHDGESPWGRQLARWSNDTRSARR